MIPFKAVLIALACFASHMAVSPQMLLNIYFSSTYKPPRGLILLTVGEVTEWIFSSRGLKENRRSNLEEPDRLVVCACRPVSGLWQLARSNIPLTPILELLRTPSLSELSHPCPDRMGNFRGKLGYKSQFSFAKGMVGVWGSDMVWLSFHILVFQWLYFIWSEQRAVSYRQSQAARHVS